MISNMISFDVLPVNSSIEDMVDTKRKILGRMRLAFDKNQWVFGIFETLEEKDLAFDGWWDVSVPPTRLRLRL